MSPLPILRFPHLPRRPLLSVLLISTFLFLLLGGWQHSQGWVSVHTRRTRHTLQLTASDLAWITERRSRKSHHPNVDSDPYEDVHDISDQGQQPLNALFPDPSLPSNVYHQFIDRPSKSWELDEKLWPVDILRGRCLDSWLTEGVIPVECHRSTTSHYPQPSAGSESVSNIHPHSPLRITFIYTWLNSSSPIWSSHKKAYSTFERIGRVQGVPDRHYRDHGELRASLRGLREAFGKKEKGKEGEDSIGRGVMGKESRGAAGRRSSPIRIILTLSDWGASYIGQEGENTIETNSGGPRGGMGRYIVGERDERVRVGQVPEWFDLETVTKRNYQMKTGNAHSGSELDHEPDIKIVWHSQIMSTFNLPPSSAKAESREEKSQRRQDFLKERLPTFNSFSIEMGGLWNAEGMREWGGGRFVYMNDDFFLLAPHNPTDFHSPSSIYGPLIPFIFAEKNYTSPIDKFPPQRKPDSKSWLAQEKEWISQNKIPGGGFVNFPVGSALSCNDEWASLTRANRMIGLRFGFRLRPGHMHIPKPILAPILHEASLIWGPSQFSHSTTRRFREDARTKPGDINAVYISELLLVERSREAILWSWMVAKLGEESGIPGRLGRKANLEIRRILRIPNPKRLAWFGVFGGDDLDEVIIPKTDDSLRHTLRKQNVVKSLRDLGEEPPIANTYGYTSLDGPLPPFGATVYNCSIVLFSCFGTWWTRSYASETATTSAANMFVKIAFTKPQCGDCLLSALMQSSGKLGMRDVLPATGAVFSVSGKGDEDDDGDEVEQPHLPLTDKVSETDFSIEAVFRRGSWKGDIDLRSWCEELIARYTWSAMVNSTAIFKMMNGHQAIENAIAAIDAEPPPAAAVLNDDIPSPLRPESAVQAADDMARRVTSWLANKWKERAPWERKDI